MKRTLTILGCGPSGGVPRVATGWGNCDAANPRNRRTRCSALIEQTGPDGGVTRILIDASPDLREQLLRADVRALDACVITHDHADHTHGIDDLRPIVFKRRQRLPVYMDDLTASTLLERFAYAFRSKKKEYQPLFEDHRIADGEPFEISGAGGTVTLLPFLQDHGPQPSLGFRMGDLAYSSDVVGFPPGAIEAVQGVRTWVLDALRYEPHTTHFSLRQAVEWIERIGPDHAVLTHMLQDLDYDRVAAETPDHIEPAYDGMVLEWS